MILVRNSTRAKCGKFEGSENSDSYEKRVDSYFIQCQFDTRVKKKMQKKKLWKYSILVKNRIPF